MTTNLSSLRRSRYGAIALAILLAATVVGCAQAPGNSVDPAAGSGSSVPGQIDYHGFPYNIQAG
jgi:hypothetical protein